MRLFLHIGHGKTGSSFMQSWIACNSSSLLNDHGILVPGLESQASLGHFSKGNKPELDAFLLDTNPLAWVENQCLKSSINSNDCKGLLFTFEGLARNFHILSDQLLEIAFSLDVKIVDLLLYVRDPLDHASSVYNQMVKRHGFSGSLDQWLEVYDFPFYLLKSLEQISSKRMSFRLHVEHYKNCSRDVVSPFLNWLDINPLCQPWSKPPASIVNRSLTIDELKLMRLVNAKVGKSAAKVGENLVNLLPDLRSDAVVPSTVSVQDFILRWRFSVASINQYLPSNSQLALDDLDVSDNSSTLDADMMHISSKQILCLLNGLLD